MKKTLSYLRKLKTLRQPIVSLTAYDAAFTFWSLNAEVDVILVGDSLGMVMQGHDNTLSVTLEHMIYHTQMVQRANKGHSHQAWCIVDLPFGTDILANSAIESAIRLIKEGGADMVKLEGGTRVIPMVSALAQAGVPVCGHLGLLPQSVLKKGYRVQGRQADEAQQIKQEAMALESAGADMLILECVPSRLAEEIAQALSIPVIGIGSGANTDGQVLVVYDVVGLTPGKRPSFSEDFLAQTHSIEQAIRLYAEAVRAKQFPTSSHEITT